MKALSCDVKCHNASIRGIMQVTSRFTLAIHAILFIRCYEETRKVTSAELARSIGADATIIRRVLGQLQSAGIVNVRPGVGGASIARPLAEVNLLDIYEAIEASNGPMFKFYKTKDPTCRVAASIHTAIDESLAKIEDAMFDEMRAINMESLYRKIVPLLGFFE